MAISSPWASWSTGFLSVGLGLAVSFSMIFFFPDEAPWSFIFNSFPRAQPFACLTSLATSIWEEVLARLVSCATTTSLAITCSRSQEFLDHSATASAWRRAKPVFQLPPRGTGCKTAKLAELASFCFGPGEMQLVDRGHQVAGSDHPVPSRARRHLEGSHWRQELVQNDDFGYAEQQLGPWHSISLESRWAAAAGFVLDLLQLAEIWSTACTG